MHLFEHWPSPMQPARGDCKQVVDAIAGQKFAQVLRKGGPHAGSLKKILLATACTKKDNITLEKVKAHVDEKSLRQEAVEERAAARGNDFADEAAKTGAALHHTCSL